MFDLGEAVCWCLALMCFDMSPLVYLLTFLYCIKLSGRRIHTEHTAICTKDIDPVGKGGLCFRGGGFLCLCFLLVREVVVSLCLFFPYLF